MGEYKSYQHYKSTNLPWIPEIPAGWHVRKLNHAISYEVGFTPESGKSEYYGDDYHWANISDLGPKFLSETSKGITEEAILKYKKKPARKGSLLYSFKLSVGQVSFAGNDMYTNEAIASFNGSEHLDLSYFYFLAPIAIIQNASENIYGAKILNQEAIGAAKVIIPPVEEQKAIARFLSHKTAQIDSLIDKKQSLLNKLTEERSFLIHQAVTKGVDLSVPMEVSDEAWLGMIPSHWETKRLRFLMTMSGGLTPKTSEARYWGGDIPWISPKDMKSERLTASMDNVTEDALQETTLRLYQSGKVLIVVRGMILSHTFPVAVNEVPVTVNQDMKVLETTMNPEYLAVLLRGIQSLVLSIVEESAHGTKVLRTDLLKDMVLPVPPRVEQDEIVSEVARISSRIDKMVSTVTAAITKLQEYRSALITNAVTGKIDVRDFCIPTTTEQREVAHG